MIKFIFITRCVLFAEGPLPERAAFPLAIYSFLHFLSFFSFVSRFLCFLASFPPRLSCLSRFVLLTKQKGNFFLLNLSLSLSLYLHLSVSLAIYDSPLAFENPPLVESNLLLFTLWKFNGFPGNSSPFFFL